MKKTLITAALILYAGSVFALGGFQEDYIEETHPVGGDAIVMEYADGSATRFLYFENFVVNYLNTIYYTQSEIDALIPTEASLGVDDLKTLSGVAGGSVNLGSFTGTTIADNQNNKQAFQALENAVEGAAGGHDAVTLNATATAGGMALLGQDISNRAATNAQTGYATAAQITAQEANTAAVAGLGTASTGTLVTTIGDPGSDTNIPTEKAVNDAFSSKTFNLKGLDTSLLWNDGVEYIDHLYSLAIGSKEMAWTIYDSDTDTAVADGKQAFPVPSSYVGFNLVDMTCSVADLNSAASGTTTVVLRRVRGATAVDMTSTGVTIAYNEYTASDETVDTANDDLVLGDKLYVDIDAITTAVQKGLSCSAVFRLP